MHNILKFACFCEWILFCFSLTIVADMFFLSSTIQALEQTSSNWPIRANKLKDLPMDTGETGRRYGVREKEHRKYVDSVGENKFTRARRKESVEDYHPSALMDHVAQSNHTIDCRHAKMSSSHPLFRFELFP